MRKEKDTSSFIKEALSTRKANNQFRSLNELQSQGNHTQITIDGKLFINFSSNDYLGLSTHPTVISRAKQYLDSDGAGACSSRLITGNRTIHTHLEKKLAAFLGKKAVLLFNSGFQANVSVLSAIADRNSLILADKQIHNSLIQGAILSRATLQRFRHNDYGDLENKLKEAQNKSFNRIWIVSESLFSMDGDTSDVLKLSDLAHRYAANLYLDDAHAVGALNKDGKGLCSNIPNLDILIGTFGKAFGSSGAYVACSNKMKEYLINYCNGFIYSTAIAPPIIGAIDAALALIPSMEKEREFLIEQSKFLRNELSKLGFDTLNSNSHIIPIVIGDESRTIALSEELKGQGIWVSAIRPPTVAKNKSRLRITLTVQHTKEQITELVEHLSQWKKKQKY